MALTRGRTEFHLTTHLQNYHYKRIRVVGLRPVFLDSKGPLSGSRFSSPRTFRDPTPDRPSKEQRPPLGSVCRYWDGTGNSVTYRSTLEGLCLTPRTFPFPGPTKQTPGSRSPTLTYCLFIRLLGYVSSSHTSFESKRPFLLLGLRPSEVEDVLRPG